MAESMSDERLAEIREAAAQYRGSTIVRRKRNSAIAHRAELLAEMDRLRAERNDNAHLAADFLAERNEARAELEQLRAERAALGGAEHQWRIVSPNGPVRSFSQRDLDDHANWLPGVRLEQRTVYGTPWEPADPQQIKRERAGEPT